MLLSKSTKEVVSADLRSEKAKDISDKVTYEMEEKTDSYNSFHFKLTWPEEIEKLKVHATLVGLKDGEEVFRMSDDRTVKREDDFSQLLVFLDHRLVDVEFLNAVLPRVLKLLCTRHVVGTHRLAHLQCGIDADAVEASQLLRIHTTHRRADDEVRLLFLADVAQQGDALLRVNGNVGSHDAGLGHDRAQSADGARLAAGGKTVAVEHRLAGHQFGILFDVGILHRAFLCNLEVAKVVKF